MNRVLRRLVVGLLLLAALVSPSLAVAQGDLPGPITREAYHILLDQFAVTPASEALVTAAWSGAVRHVRRFTPVPSTPGLTLVGNRDLDWAEFERAVPLLPIPAAARPGLDAAIVSAMAESLNEGHTRYLPAAAYDRSRAEQRGDYSASGVGLTLATDYTILDVVEGTPAAAARLRTGDRLQGINGSVVFSMQRAQVNALLAAPAGTPLTLRVLPAGATEARDVSLATAVIESPWVTGWIMDGNIGYLKVRRFEFLGGEAGAARLRLLDAILGSFREASVGGIVLDLRNNPGGSLQTGQMLLGRFLAAGTGLYQVHERNRDPRTVMSNARQAPLQVPVVVLLNRGSASMAEMTASALSENGVARLVGTRSRGSVATATLRGLSDGSGLYVTVSLVRSLSGKELNGVGIAPDVPAELVQQELWQGRDSQLEAALTDLYRTLSRAALDAADALPSAASLAPAASAP